MESVIYSVLKIDLRNLVRNKVHISKRYHIQPSELERMPYWEYELMLEYINEDIEAENKQNDEQNKQMDGYKKPNYNRMMSQAGIKPPKMPSMPKI